MDALRYALPNARVRAMVAQLLTPEQKGRLIASPRVEDALQQLRATAYAPELAALTQGRPPLLPVERAFERSLVRAYRHIIAALSGRPAELIILMLQRLDEDNLKAILRGLATGRPPDETRRVLVPLGRFGRLPIDRLLSVTNVGAAVAALEGTVYARVLREGLPAYERERALFPLEVGLDLDYYRRLWQAAERLPGRDRQAALSLLGTRYDLANVDWIARYKEVYHLSPVEIFNLTLPYGRRVNDEVVRRAAAAPDLAALIAALPEPYREALAPEARPDELWRLETSLNRYLWRQARAALADYPFTIAVIMGYLWLKEAEVHDLSTIMEGKSYGCSPGEVRAFLWGEG